MRDTSIAYLVQSVIRPALEGFGHPDYPSFGHPAAVQLVAGTAAVESGFAALRQHPSGPALGLWQIEPDTASDIRLHYLAHRDTLRRYVELHMHTAGPWVHQLATNLVVGALFARLVYLRRPERLPAAFDVLGQARYWKEHYNTRLGAGTAEHYVAAWQRLCAPHFAPPRHAA